MSYTRREMLIGLAGAGGAALIVPGIIRAAVPLPAGRMLLDADKWRTLAAVSERLLPGAVEAGVPDYMDYWLVQRAFERVRLYLAHGAQHLDQTARKGFGKPFSECAGSEQDGILSEFAAGKVKVDRFDGHVFVRQMMVFVLEGFLADPKYRGNRDRVGWRFIGIPDGLRSCWWNPDGVQMVLSPEQGFQD